MVDVLQHNLGTQEILVYLYAQEQSGDATRIAEGEYLGWFTSDDNSIVIVQQTVGSVTARVLIWKLG